jgi:hypothetical protein
MANELPSKLKENLWPSCSLGVGHHRYIRIGAGLPILIIVVVLLLRR